MKVDFYLTPSGRSPILDFVRTLSKRDQARFKDVYEGIEGYGLDYQRVQFRQLQGKLWEIKFSCEGGRYRAAYVMLRGDWMVWLHAFKKKTRETPKTDLELALRRMKEVLAS